MRLASFPGTLFVLSLASFLGVMAPRQALAAPASASAAQNRASSQKPKASKRTAKKGVSADAAAATSAPPTATPEEDPWEGRGAPTTEADPSAAEPPPLPPEPPPDEPPMDPRTAYHKGNAAFRDGRFTAARHYYRRALEGDTSFDVLCNLGRAEAELKDNVPAFVHLSFCLDLYPRDPELSATRQSFGKLREEVQNRLSVEQQERADALYAEGPPKPVVKEEPAPAVVVARPSAPPPDVDLGPRSPGLRTAVTLTLGSLALAGIGGGVGFYIYSDQLGKDATALQGDIRESGVGCPSHPDCEALTDTLIQSDSAQHIALGSFIAGGALATAAVLTYVLWPHEYGPEKSAARPTTTAARTLRHLRPLGTFDPARGSMWLGLRGQF